MENTLALFGRDRVVDQLHEILDRRGKRRFGVERINPRASHFFGHKHPCPFKAIELAFDGVERHLIVLSDCRRVDLPAMKHVE